VPLKVQMHMVTKLVEIIAQMPDSQGSEMLAARVLFECCGLSSMQKLKI